MTGEPGAEEVDHEHHTGVVRGLFVSTIGALRTRLDLAAVEAEIFLLHAISMMLWAVAALACALLGLVFGVVSLIAAVWDTHRLLGLLGGTALFFVLGAVFALIAARTFKARPRMLEGTLTQLESDQNHVRGAP